MVNGAPDFGLISGGVKGITDQDAPIRLQRGDTLFGAAHIEEKHGHWVKTTKLSVPGLDWTKCRQTGSIYSTEQTTKGKIWMPLAPSDLMVLQYVAGKNYWAVISLYFHEGTLDGDLIGRYTDTMAPPTAAMPEFTIQDLPKPPQVSIKKKRVWTKPS
jgi:hypothetical protein